MMDDHDLSTGPALCEPELRFSLSPSEFALECGMRGHIISEAFGAMHRMNRRSERRVAVGFPLMTAHDIGDIISFVGDEEMMGGLYQMMTERLKNGSVVMSDLSAPVSGEFMAFHRNRIPEEMTASFKKRILRRAERRGRPILPKGKKGQWESREKTYWGPHAVLRTASGTNSINMMMSRPNGDVVNGPLMVNTYGLSGKNTPAFIRF